MDAMVIVIGGGVAGASCALALARAGERVMLVEGEPASRWKIGETLGPEARPLLQSLGLWEAFARAGHLPCHGNASVWGWDGLAEKDFIFHPHGHAWQLDRRLFEEQLIAAAAQAGAAVRRGQMADDLDWNGGLWQVRLGAQKFSARWLIDASGRRAMVARKAGVERKILDRLVAVYGVATSQSGSDQDSRTFVEAAPAGWWYSALTPGGRRTVSFQTDADLIPGEEWRTREWFAGQLGETRRISRLVAGHDYVFNGPPQLTSAHSGRLEQFAGDGWLAAGDAASSFDPLSGHGILHAVRSGIQAAQAVTGDEADRTAYAAWSEGLWANFRQLRNDYYRTDKRFTGSVFWERRHG
jgi:flavin-dependent dehydrogenase